eukprot:GHVS01006212.1.p1 GENE.GHVS01006212.1~~GHVS01006212.1.p1  ORF type:complete len:293 (+),score=13.37 GHVS01006212.1:62-940(+)
MSSVLVSSLPLSRLVPSPFPVTSPIASSSSKAKCFHRCLSKAAACRFLFLRAIVYIIPMIITFTLIAVHMLVAPVTHHISIYPRTLKGTVGILASCWGHWSWSHWANNMIGWLGLCPLMLSFGVWPFMLHSGFIQILSASLVWGLAKSGIHAGMSGLLCGYFGFLVVSVFFDQRGGMKTIAVAGVTAMIYGAMFMATLTYFGPRVSWESHISGVFSGVGFSALFFCKLERCMSDPIAAIKRLLRRISMGRLSRQARAGTSAKPSRLAPPTVADIERRILFLHVALLALRAPP